MFMNMLSCGNLMRGVTDGKSVFEYILALGDVADSHFVLEQDVVEQCDCCSVHFNGVASLHVFQGYNHIVSGIEPDEWFCHSRLILYFDSGNLLRI